MRLLSVCSLDLNECSFPTFVQAENFKQSISHHWQLNTSSLL